MGFVIAMIARAACCSCEQLTATVKGESIRVSACHCLACQRRTGSVFGARARFRSDDVAIKGESKQYAREGDKGSKITFNFCSNCGATLYYSVDDRTGFIAILVGAFADPNFPAPTFSVYEDRKHAWVSLPDGIERMA
jgi:hypothetical protein